MGRFHTLDNRRGMTGEIRQTHGRHTRKVVMRRILKIMAGSVKPLFVSKQRKFRSVAARLAA